MARARVLVADDHVLVASGLRGLREPEFELVDTVSNGRELVERAHALQTSSSQIFRCRS